jgi:hypothetical protein
MKFRIMRKAHPGGGHDTIKFEIEGKAVINVLLTSENFGLALTGKEVKCEVIKSAKPDGMIGATKADIKKGKKKK